MFKPLTKLYRLICFIVEPAFLRVRYLIVPLANLFLLQAIGWWGYNAIVKLRKYEIQKTISEMFQKYSWNTNNPPDMDIMNPILDQVERAFDFKVYILVAFLVFATLFEVFGRVTNSRVKTKLSRSNTSGDWASKDSYDFIVTLFDRMFAIALYLYPAVDVFVRNANAVYKIYPQYAELLNVTVAPVCDWYITNVWGSFFGYGQGILFFFMYYGIARNRDNMKYFIRYHATQSIMVHGLYIFINQLGDTCFYRNAQPIYGDRFGAQVVWTLGLLLLPMVISAFIGFETKILFWDEAIQYHIGPRPKRKSQGNG